MVCLGLTRVSIRPDFSYLLILDVSEEKPRVLDPVGGSEGGFKNRGQGYLQVQKFEILPKSFFKN